MAEKLIQEIGDTCIIESQNQFCVVHKGQVVVPYGKYAWIDKFDNGLARVRTAGLTNAGGFVVHLIPVDELQPNDGETTQTRYYKERDEHPERFAKWGIINEQGEEVLPLEYDEVWNFYGKNRKSTYVEKNKQAWDFILSNCSLIPHRG